MQTVTLEQLKEYLTPDTKIEAIAKGHQFIVQIFHNDHQSILAKARSSEPRLFRSPLEVLNVFKKLGVEQVIFSLNHYEPEGKTMTRPDRAIAMKQTHQDAAYNEWFRNEVQKGIDDPVRIPHEEVMKLLAPMLAEIRKKASQQG